MFWPASQHWSMLFENVEKRRIISFYLNKHTRCTRVFIAALLETAQQSGNSSGKAAFNSPIFSQVFRRLKHVLIEKHAYSTLIHHPSHHCFSYFSAFFT